MLKEIFNLARGNISDGDSDDEYQARREALGLMDSDPRDSASVAQATLSIEPERWLSRGWRSSLSKCQSTVTVD